MFPQRQKITNNSRFPLESHILSPTLIQNCISSTIQSYFVVIFKNGILLAKLFYLEDVFGLIPIFGIVDELKIYACLESQNLKSVNNLEHLSLAV